MVVRVMIGGEGLNRLYVATTLAFTKFYLCAVCKMEYTTIGVKFTQLLMSSLGCGILL